MLVMTSLVCVMYGRRTAAVGCAVVHRVIVRVLMPHKIALNVVKNPVVEASCATSTARRCSGNGSALLPRESVHARYYPEHRAKQFVTVFTISADRMSQKAIA